VFKVTKYIYEDLEIYEEIFKSLPNLREQYFTNLISNYLMIMEKIKETITIAENDLNSIMKFIYKKSNYMEPLIFNLFERVGDEGINDKTPTILADIDSDINKIKYIIKKCNQFQKQGINYFKMQNLEDYIKITNRINKIYSLL
jgi:hypothetical protein